ncbi:MAG: S8 family serine peptidase [Roseiflexaceae bacterium]
MKHLHRALVLALLLSLWPLSIGAASAAPRGALAGELVLKLRPGAMLDADARAHGPHAALLDALLRAAGAGAAASLGSNSDTYRVRLRASADLMMLARRLSANPAVVFAEPNHIRTLMRTPDDPVIGQQWALRNIHALEAWDITTGGDITIAVLDTGISRSHPDLKGKVLPGYDFANDDADPNDDEGHGTYTAGVAAANSNNGTGIAGVCWGCKILPVKVLNRRGQGDDASIAAGIRWAVDQGARIISMSLGGTDDTQVLRDAVAYAHERNALLIAASGNGQADGNRPNYPAAYPGVLAVSATTPSDQVTGFSSTGDYVGIAAPGVGVWSTLWDRDEGNTYGAANGTSAACPHVAGAAALVLSLRPDLSADQLAEILQASADDQGAPGKDPQEGYGRLNLLRAVQMAADPNILSRSRIQGRVLGALAGVTVALDTGQQTQPDGSGFYSFDNLPAGAYTVSLSGPGANAAPQQTWVSGTPLSVATIDFVLGLDAAQFFQPVPPPLDGATYFPETGHTLGGAFSAYWLANGGLPIFGYPTSQEFVEPGEDGRDHVVQYFERHRLEQHAENQPPYHILLSRLGNAILAQSGRDWFAFPKGTPQPGCMFFEATGHSLCEPFLSYWRTHGLEFDGQHGTSEAESLALFGQALSEPQIEVSSDGQPYVTQWFERARFEDHGAQGVLLGLLANELAAARGWKR